MIDAQLRVTWSCQSCNAGGPVDLLTIQRERGPSYSLVDRRAPCETPGCKGRVTFHYSGGVGTPLRPRRASRERAEAAKRKVSDQMMKQAKETYNAVALHYQRPPLP